MTQTASLDSFRSHALSILGADPRITAVLEAGAGAENRADRYSDLDLVVIASDADYDAVLSDRGALAARLGSLLSSFTGEHVGEPRLLICLYSVPGGDRVLHVDLKVVRLADLSHRVDDPQVLLDKANACTSVMASSSAVWPERPPQWFEDRIWIWLHYAAARAGRGELFEALDMVSYLRAWVLGPMLATSDGRPQRGLRHIEAIPQATEVLASTVAGPDIASLKRALLAILNLYVRLRRINPPAIIRRDAESAVIVYIEEVLSE